MIQLLYITPPKIEPNDTRRLIDVRLHNRYPSLTDMCENVQIYVGEHTYIVFVGLRNTNHKPDFIIQLFLLEKQLNYQENK